MALRAVRKRVRHDNLKSGILSPHLLDEDEVADSLHISSANNPADPDGSERPSLPCLRQRCFIILVFGDCFIEIEEDAGDGGGRGKLGERVGGEIQSDGLVAF